ncbi:hypothetical protein RRG08_036912 [Elysia crispata]|uniref:Uncharacterized protein n=1 Tax=Elysia crispata TaxID=231223 RepID=A0AAE0ZIC8_9GAST|nr:hypothetical protein RRG08_036912 [Elysia crispata]
MAGLTHHQKTFSGFSHGDLDGVKIVTSREFQDFGHIHSALNHPPPDVAAERAVETFKTNLAKMPTSTIHEKVNIILFKYRITPHSTTGTRPLLN